MILAADIGTSSLKAGILSPDGELISRVRIPYGHPPGLHNEEFDPMQWETAFLESLKILPPAHIDAVAISGNGPTLISCNADGMPLAPAIMWLHSNEPIVKGQPSYFLPKAAWLKQANPDVWKKTRWLFSPPEWLQFRLTGIPAMTTPNKEFIPWLWDPEQMAAYGVEQAFFPDIVTMGIPIGHIGRKASARTGLPDTAIVAAVGSDFMATLLGVGITEPGMVCDRAGTSEGINVCANRPASDTRLQSLPHLVKELWNVAAILQSTGAVFEWYRRLTGQQNRSYKATLADVNKVEPGINAPLFFPAPQGTVRWAFGGGSFHRLEAGHGPAEMGRAVMEAIGYGVRRGIDLLEAAGMPVQDMRVTGGQARGEVWNQMKANITGRRLLIPKIEDAELAGGAACALAAMGKAADISEGAIPFVRIKTVVEPDANTVKVYNDAYYHYSELAGIEEN